MTWGSLVQLHGPPGGGHAAGLDYLRSQKIMNKVEKLIYKWAYFKKALNTWTLTKISKKNAGFKVLTAMSIASTVVWDVTSYSPYMGPNVLRNLMGPSSGHYHITLQLVLRLPTNHPASMVEEFDAPTAADMRTAIRTAYTLQLFRRIQRYMLGQLAWRKLMCRRFRFVR